MSPTLPLPEHRSPAKTPNDGDAALPEPHADGTEPPSLSASLNPTQKVLKPPLFLARTLKV